MVRVAAAAVSAPPSELTLSPSLVVVAAPAPAPPQLFSEGIGAENYPPLSLSALCCRQRRALMKFQNVTFQPISDLHSIHSCFTEFGEKLIYVSCF